MRKGTLLYTGNFCFPDEDAGARRTFGVGKCLKSLGYDVVYLGAEAAGREQDTRQNNGYIYREFIYLPSGVSRDSILQRLWRLFYVHLSGLSAISRVKKLIERRSVGVIAYQATSLALLLMRHVCSRHGIPMIVDVVEWYERRHVPGGRLGPFALDSEMRMRYVNLKADGIMTISRFLEDYYRKRGKLVCRIPPLIDLEEKVWAQRDIAQEYQPFLKLIFIGNAGKKDLVVNAIRGLAILGSDSKYCRLSIIGPSHKEISANLARDAYLLQGDRLDVDIPGRVSRDEALRKLASSDFSLVIRPTARFSIAGFPTKLVESLAMGVPVITNTTGDIEMYIHDGIDGVIIPDESPQAFADGVRRALALSRTQKATMRKCARQCAEESFDYRKWIEPINSFFKDVLSG